MFHITTRPEIESAQPNHLYAPQAFDQEGFIHCSYIHQIIEVANRLFHHQTNLVILEIDTSQLDCKIVDENLEGGAELFPHIYGVLPFSAIVKIHDFPCDANGYFQIPPSLAG
ncbi:MAG: DUF952 domain-containing protein [Leptolyngbyaceae bacterium]|nr:DUF952 domain-containing protein [Leptolyngbyaceae bacterium]